MNVWYVLNPDRTVREAASLEEGAAFLSDPKNKILVQNVGAAGRWVSTVFLGLDHSWLPGEDPVVFETMIFEPGWGTKKHKPIDWEKIKKGRYKPEKGRPNQRTELHGWQDRYRTYDEAIAGHVAALALLAREFPGNKAAGKRRIRKLTASRIARQQAVQAADRRQQELKQHLLRGHTVGSFS